MGIENLAGWKFPGLVEANIGVLRLIDQELTSARKTKVTKLIAITQTLMRTNPTKVASWDETSIDPCSCSCSAILTIPFLHSRIM